MILSRTKLTNSMRSRRGRVDCRGEKRGVFHSRERERDSNGRGQGACEVMVGVRDGWRVLGSIRSYS